MDFGNSEKGFMKPLLIGIAGGKGEGKDTVAQIICNAFLFDSVRMAFADSLKQECADLLSLTVHEINASKQVFRPLLQWYGTEYRRQYNGGESYWVDKLVEKVNLYDGKIVIIPDVRFPNEYEFIKANGGIMLKVTRDIFRDHLSTHTSETSLPPEFFKFDFTLVNNGTPEQLTQSVNMLIENLIKPKL